ncbi:unnamed protein product [Musa textilis]
MFSKPPIVPPLSLPLTIDEQPIAPLSEDPQTNPTSSEAVAPVEQPPIPETDRPVEDVRELHLNAAAVHIQYHGSLSIEVSQVKWACSMHGCIIDLYVSWHGLVMIIICSIKSLFPFSSSFCLVNIVSGHRWHAYFVHIPRVSGYSCSLPTLFYRMSSMHHGGNNVDTILHGLLNM